MSNDVTATQDPNVTLNVQQLEEVIRKVVREELMAFATQEQGIFTSIRNLRFIRIWRTFLNEKNPVS